MTAATSPTPVEVHADDVVPSWKLLLTLGLAGAASGLLIVLLYIWTLPGIEAHKAGIMRTAITQVLKNPSRSDTLYLIGGALTAAAPPTDATAHVERVYRGYDASGKPIGYAIEAKGPGFSETIHLIFGVDVQKHELLGMTVLESKETPGIADDIERPVFTSQFAGAKTPVEGVKASRQDKPPGTVVMITGATISSRSVLKAINTTLARWQPLIEQYEHSGHGSR
jgi:H+/Na+-translocating ferredoxin:NAD+ oxidoreductase subunit G